MYRDRLPPELGDRFSVAEARGLGVPYGMLRSTRLERPFHGVRAKSAAVSDTPEGMLREAALQYARRMTEHEFFSHVAAAAIWGFPLPIGLVRRRSLDVAVFAPRRAPSGKGVIGHALSPGHAHTVRHPEHGFQIASPASTWAMLGGLLIDQYDLVAAADAAVRVPMHHEDPPALSTPDQLRAAVQAGRRVGVPSLRAALPRISTRARSRPETWLRLLVIDAGLPEPEVNADVYDDRGRWLAQVDLSYPNLKIALEYEGEYHLTDPAQWAADIARMDRLVEAGWRVIRVTKGEVFGNPTELIARIRRAIAVASR